MNTNNIKSFAKQARLILMDGVLQRLKYWGFNLDGSNEMQLQSTQGGYIFRGQIFTDTAVPEKWNKLKKKLTDKLAVQDILEEAAYTWFNRLIAIKILESNGYIPEQLAYTNGLRTPMIVQNARRGQYTLNKQSDKDLLMEYLQEEKEEQAFGLLLSDFCNRNSLLHNVFGRIDDYTEILLPQNLLQINGLLDLINSNGITESDYKEVELIGWLYQFYIADKKDEVFAGFKKNIKARAQDIPAATQIFTPKWIVKYMVENTVGKIYLDYNPNAELKKELKYLVENDSDKDSKPIITSLKDLTLIDPASGSGHILVTGFGLLFLMYREEGYTARQAVENILEFNLFGLDIDDRAMQLSRFAVLLKAALYDAEILNKGVLPHIYSFPEAENFANEELLSFLGNDGNKYIAEFKEALQLLNQGKNIGSALKLVLSKWAFDFINQQYINWHKLSNTAALDILQSGVWNRLKPFLDIMLLLTRQYTAVVANPPYMGQKSMNNDLKDYVNEHYPKTKSDLMTVFMEVIPNLTLDQSRFALINLPSWLFLSSFEVIRKDYIDNFQFDSLLHMGRGIFGIDFGSVAFAIKKTQNKNSIGSYFRLHERNFQHIYYEDIEKLFLYSNNNEEYKYDFSQYRGEDGITEIPKEGSSKGMKLFYPNISQINFSKIPGSPIAFWVSMTILNNFDKGNPLGEIADTRLGMSTNDNNRFIRLWTEISKLKLILNAENAVIAKESMKKWFPYNKGGGYRKWYGNLEYVINYENDGEEVKGYAAQLYGSYTRTCKNIQYFFRSGLTWSLISSQKFSCRLLNSGAVIGDAGPTCYPENENKNFILSLLNTSLANEILNLLNPTINFSPGVLKLFPVLFSNNYHIIDDLTQTCINISKADWDFQEISLDFEKSPLLAESNSFKQAFLIWQNKANKDFYQLHSNEEELNSMFLDIYGLKDELTPEVALKDITILQQEMDTNALEQLEPVFREKGKDAIELPIKKTEVLSQFLSYAVGVFMGRYRLDKPGLNIAHPNPSEHELSSYNYNNHKIEIDEDGILPIMGLDCAFPDDILHRTKDLILAIWGEDTLTENINFLQECLEMDLHKWLTEKFWAYHTSMYKKKPIYWLFSSNPAKPQNAAFKVLVYMHRMDKYTVQKIQRSYLHPHQEFIKREIEKLLENENNLEKQELKRLELLRNWELECRDYNEVLKEFAKQQIEFDLDDGVEVNYVKFEGAVAKI